MTVYRTAFPAATFALTASCEGNVASTMNAVGGGAYQGTNTNDRRLNSSYPVVGASTLPADGSVTANGWRVQYDTGDTAPETDGFVFVVCVP